MAKAPIIYVDRRKSVSQKSSPNRERLLRRIKAAIKAATPSSIGSVAVSSATNNQQNPISVAKSVLHEPRFMYAKSDGVFDVVLPGNDQFERGDIIKSSSSSGGSGGNGNGAGSGDGEDDFIVEVSTQEFQDAFFEDCELPNMEESAERITPESEVAFAGFAKTGNPSALRVIRSFKQAMPRRMNLSKPLREELELLLTELADTDDDERIAEINARIAEVERKLAAIPLFEDIDLRYARTERREVRTADAVFIMIMDISGSMDEKKKLIARKFFSLQYAFIKRKYPGTQLVFIAHTEEAVEFTESDFFTTRISGGTIVSGAYDLASTIIKQRYDPSQTNIYVAQATDGDNLFSDNAKCVDALTKSGGLLQQIRHMCTVYVSSDSYLDPNSEYSLIGTLKKLNRNGIKKLDIVDIETVEQVYPKFKDVYKKKGTK